MNRLSLLTNMAGENGRFSPYNNHPLWLLIVWTPTLWLLLLLLLFGLAVRQVGHFPSFGRPDPSDIVGAGWLYPIVVLGQLWLLISLLFTLLFWWLTRLRPSSASMTVYLITTAVWLTFPFSHLQLYENGRWLIHPLTYLLLLPYLLQIGWAWRQKLTPLVATLPRTTLFLATAAAYWYLTSPLANQLQVWLAD